MFAQQVRYGTGMHTLDLWVDEFTGDGRLDVAALVGLPPSELSTAVAIVEGRPAPATPGFHPFRLRRRDARAEPGARPPPSTVRGSR